MPILNKYPILSNKQYDFFKENLIKDIKLYKDLKSETRPKGTHEFCRRYFKKTSYFMTYWFYRS